MPKKLNTEEFIVRANRIHENLYDYSLSIYKNDSTKIKIICREHGIFEQRPGDHVRLKQGCPKCGDIKNGNRCRKANESIISQINNAWGFDHFDFSEMNYTDAHSKIKLKCVKHDMWFEQYPGAVFKKLIGCPECCKIKRELKHESKFKSSFINNSLKIHGNLYDYSKVIYVNQNIPVTIICKIHGEFNQKPGNHSAGNGCQKCNYSKGEHCVAKTLNEFNIEFIHQYMVKVDGRRSVFDFYLPAFNTMIEYNGSQHYSPSRWSHKMTDEEVLSLFEIQKYKDELKRIYCSEHNLKLIEIPYTDFKRISEIIEKHLNLL